MQYPNNKSMVPIAKASIKECPKFIINFGLDVAFFLIKKSDIILKYDATLNVFTTE
jgi:hypothetical protein